jgi:hypothetical protein
MLGEPVTVDVIEIERLSKVLGDRTAFDAFARLTTSSGPACVAIETKLTEPFSQKDYDWPKYTSHELYDSTAWSTNDVALLGDRRWSQLWRNHMLGLAESKRHGLGRVFVCVVYHPLDPHCRANIDGYRSLVAAPNQLLSAPLDELVEALQPHASGDLAARQWLDDVRDRYLNLSLSEPLLALT